MNDRIIADIASKFSDCKFFLGDITGDMGWDCLSSLRNFYVSCGVAFPDEFRGFNAGNYAERWRKGEGRPELREFLLGLGRPIARNYERRGDMVVFEKPPDQVFPGIYLGDDHVAIVFDVGGRVCKLKHLDLFVNVIGIRRLD